MYTYKVTYFDGDMDVAEVVTYHSLGGDAVMGELVLNNMRTKEYPAVKIMKNDGNGYRNITKGFLYFERKRIAALTRMFS